MSIAWNDIITTIIATLTAVISLFAFVYQYTLKPRLDAQIGQEILVHYTEHGQLVLTATFVFMNRGAQPTAMTGLFGTIWSDNSIDPDSATLKDPSLVWDKLNEYNLVWGQFEEVKRTTPIGRKARYSSGSSGVAETMVVPGRDASPPHMIRLFSREILSLASLYPEEGRPPEPGAEPGPGAGAGPGPKVYMLVLLAVDGSIRGTRGSTLTCRLFLNRQDEEKLRDYGTESEGEIRSRIRFRRQLSLAERQESLVRRMQSKIPFKTKAARATIIDFVSDGNWSKTPRPPGAPPNQTSPPSPPIIEMTCYRVS